MAEKDENMVKNNLQSQDGDENIEENGSDSIEDDEDTLSQNGKLGFIYFYAKKIL